MKNDLTVPVDKISPQPIRLSLCMIMRNEEPCLEACLLSVSDLVDEMIIVDTGSTDQSVALAEKFGAKVYHHSWESDFALARNQSIGYAQKEWILIMDADERISEAAYDWLIVFKSRPQLARIYQTQIVNLDQAGQAINAFFMQRLFPNTVGLKFRSAIHECLIFNDSMSQPMPINETTLEIPFFYHIGTQPFHIERQQKRQRNFEILNIETAKYPHEPHLLYHLANAYRNLGQTSQAISVFQQIFRLRAANDNPDHPMFAQAITEWIESQLHLNRADLAIAIAENHVHPLYPPSYWYYLGHAFRKVKDENQARKCFESALSLDPLRSGRSLKITHEIAHMRQLPLLQLAYIFLFQALHPSSSLAQRIEALTLRLNVCQQLIYLFPSGDWPENKINLYLGLAESLLLRSVLQKKSHLPNLFEETIHPNFHLQSAFEAVNSAWKTLGQQSSDPVSRLAQDSRLWLQGIFFNEVSYHQQLWQEGEGGCSPELLQDYRLMSQLYFLNRKAFSE